MDTRSIEDRERYIPWPRRCADLPAVAVWDNDIEKAIRVLTKAMQKSQVFRILKARRVNPAPAARQRRKAIESESRRRRLAAKRAKR